MIPMHKHIEYRFFGDKNFFGGVKYVGAVLFCSHEPCKIIGGSFGAIPEHRQRCFWASSESSAGTSFRGQYVSITLT